MPPTTFSGIGFGDVSGRKGVQQGITNLSNNLASQQSGTAGQRSSEYGTLFPGFSSLITGGGYSDAEKSAINQSTLGGINASYGSASDAASRRLARTNNSAGYGSFMDSLARNRSKDLASQNLQNQKDFADEALRRKMMGLQGIASLYGVDTSFLNSLNSGQNQLAQLGVNTYGITKNNKSFGDQFMGSLGSSLGGALGGLI